MRNIKMLVDCSRLLESAINKKITAILEKDDVGLLEAEYDCDYICQKISDIINDSDKKIEQVAINLFS